MVGLCKTFGCLPSQLYREDVELLRLLAVDGYGIPKEDGEGVAG